MEKQTLTWILVVLVALSLITSGLGYLAVGNIKVDVPQPQITNQDKIDIIQGVIANLPEPVVPEVVESDGSVLVSGDYVLNKGEFEKEATEAKAEELATAELDSRDLKKTIFNALEVAGVDIDSYKDITEIKVMDSDVDDNEVTFDVKVYYFLDGDEDETQKARLEEFTIVIDNLDFDDDFEDAEVDEDYLDTIVVRKVYE